MADTTLSVDIAARAFARTSEAVNLEVMALDLAQLPDDVATLKAMLAAANVRALDLDAQIANLKLTIAKMRRNTFGSSSEHGAKLIDQMELQLADLVEPLPRERSPLRSTGRSKMLPSKNRHVGRCPLNYRVSASCTRRTLHELVVA